MTIQEKMIDRLGQITFRLETNFLTVNSTKNEALALKCKEAIAADIEKLKELKREMQDLGWSSFFISHKL